MIYKTSLLPDTRWVCVVLNDDGTRYTKDGNVVELYAETKENAITNAQEYVSS